MTDPARGLPEDGDLHDTVPNISGTNHSTTHTVAATIGSQKSSSKSSSFSYQSETSTLAHEQTPFIEFKLQVLEICKLLWHPTPRKPVTARPGITSGHRFQAI